MKKIKIATIALIICGPCLSFSQSALTNLIVGSQADARYLTNGYLSPVLNIIGNGLNQGWYNTAKNHKFPGADLTISMSLIAIPAEDQIFKVDNTKLNTVQLTAPSTGQIPTALGASTNSTYTFRAPLTGSISGPQGIMGDINFKRLPVPIANIGIGLPKGIEIKIRYVPKINVGDGKINLFGLGLMYDIKQHIPGVKSLPFDLAAFAGFTKVKMNVAFNSGNRGAFDANATTIQALISKKLAVLTVYGGVGYNISTVKFNAIGNFDIDGSGPSTVTIKDPVAIEGKSNGPRATAGLRLKLGPITFHGDYTAQKYSSITVGFGISVR
jgi:hypothetical protein